jgi:cysteine desulfurase
MKPIYLDYAAATPIDKKVLKTLNSSQKSFFANSHSIHSLAEKGSKLISEAKKIIEQFLKIPEITFTASATEANNLMIKGLVSNFWIQTNKKPHIITTNSEHSSILEPCRVLEKEGKAEVTYLKINQNGQINLNDLKEALKENTILVSVIYANNETGAIQNLKEISKIIDGKAIFHSDACQAGNLLTLDCKELGLDAITVNGAKIYGPRNIAILATKENIKLTPIIHGGSQQKFRSSTLDAATISAFALALEIAQTTAEKNKKKALKLEEFFEKELAKYKNIKLNLKNSEKSPKLEGHFSLQALPINNQQLVLELSKANIYLSTRSACSEKEGKSSRVLESLGLNKLQINSSFRLSFGNKTTKKELSKTLETIAKTINKLQENQFKPL